MCSSDAGERVVVLDNLATCFDWAVAQGASPVIGDVGDQSRVAALMAEDQVDAVASRRLRGPGLEVTLKRLTILASVCQVRQPLVVHLNCRDPASAACFCLIESRDRKLAPR